MMQQHAHPMWVWEPPDNRLFSAFGGCFGGQQHAASASPIDPDDQHCSSNFKRFGQQQQHQNPCAASSPVCCGRVCAHT